MQKTENAVTTTIKQDFPPVEKETSVKSLKIRCEKITAEKYKLIFGLLKCSQIKFCIFTFKIIINIPHVTSIG